MGKECKSCGKSYEIGNSFHKLCHKCNEIRLKERRGVNVDNVVDIPKRDIKIRKIITKVSTIVSGDSPCKHEIVNPYNVAGQLELFKRIWDEREHICQHCDEPLGDELVVHYFSHIYPKSIRPWLKLDPDNIELLCFECHTEHDFGKRKNKLK